MWFIFFVPSVLKWRIDMFFSVLVICVCVFGIVVVFGMV